MTSILLKSVFGQPHPAGKADDAQGECFLRMCCVVPGAVSAGTHYHRVQGRSANRLPCCHGVLGPSKDRHALGMRVSIGALGSWLAICMAQEFIQVAAVAWLQQQRSRFVHSASHDLLPNG